MRPVAPLLPSLSHCYDHCFIKYFSLSPQASRLGWFHVMGRWWSSYTVPPMEDFYIFGRGFDFHQGCLHTPSLVSIHMHRWPLHQLTREIALSHLGCTGTSFLASCQCQTPKRVWLAGFQCPASVSLFFFFFFRHGSDTSDTLAVKKKKIIDFDWIPLILWYTLKQKSKFRVWEVIRLKFETNISSSQPTVPPSL